MADNVNVTEGLGKTIAADDIGGAMHQRVKISVGPDGSGSDCYAGNPLPVTTLPGTAGGLSTYSSVWPANTTGVSVKGSAGQLYGYFLYNRGGAERTVKLYDKATAPAVGTDSPVMSFPLPPSGGANLMGTMGVAFSAGIGVGVTANPGYSDSAAPASGDVTLSLWFK